MGAPRRSYPGHLFQCLDCFLFDAKLQDRPDLRNIVTPLYDTITRYAGQRVADSSADTYVSNRRRFVKFCAQQLELSPGEVLPTEPGRNVTIEHVLLFLAWAKDRYAISTLRNTLTSIGDWQQSRGVAESDTVSQHPLVQNMFRNIARARAADADTPSLVGAKAPITVPLLRLMISHCLHERSGAGWAVANACDQDIAFMVAGFFGFLRRSEMVNLRMGDVHIYTGEGCSYATIFIRKSKNDQFGRGATIYLGETSRSGVDIIKYLTRHYVNRLAGGACPSDPLFSRVLPSGSFSGHKVSKEFFAARMRQILSGLNQHFPALAIQIQLFSSHSLRRGGVVAAFEAGVPVELLKAHGRWRSDAILLYLSVSTATRLSVTNTM